MGRASNFFNNTSKSGGSSSLLTEAADLGELDFVTRTGASPSVSRRRRISSNRGRRGSGSNARAV